MLLAANLLVARDVAVFMRYAVGELFSGEAEGAKGEATEGGGGR